jgi:2-dehydropantoate 2-reductase
MWSSIDSCGIKVAAIRSMRILVVGAGAVGGYFGGRLVEANRDVTFLVRPRRAEQIKEKGLQIVSQHGNLTLHPKIITVDGIIGLYDLILLGVKSYSLSGSMRDFSSAVGPETTILPVLNGMRHIELLADRFGKHSVVGGVCLVATEIDGDGSIRQLADFQTLTYGELDSRSTPRLQRMDETLRGAGFETGISDRIVPDMWQKWVQLASLGTVNCLLRGNIGEVASIPEGIALSLSALSECADIAGACGYPPSAAFLEQQTKALTNPDSNLTSSMYRDLKNGAPVEVDTILGDLLERGRKHGLTAPLLQAAFVNLSIYQRSLDRARTMSS